jgi:hypothetical protein
MERNKLEPLLTDADGLLRRGGAALLNNLGKTVAVITVLVAILVTFTDVSFSEFGTESFTGRMLLMMLASYLMYFSLSDSGEKLCEGSEEYKAAIEKYEQARGAISCEDIEGLREYLEDYKARETEYRKGSALSSLGISAQEYRDYLAGKKFPRGKMKKLKRISRIKPPPLNTAMLLSKEKARERSELDNPERFKLLRLAIKLIPSTLGTLLTVSVMLNTKDGMSAGELVDGVMKLSTLPIIGMRGYSCGYNYVKHRYIPWIEVKTRLIEGYLQGKKY